MSSNERCLYLGTLSPCDCRFSSRSPRENMKKLLRLCLKVHSNVVLVQKFSGGHPEWMSPTTPYRSSPW